MIDSEIIKNGFIKLDNMDIEKIKEINNYNDRALYCRRVMKHISEMKFGYNIFNPLIIFALCLSCRETIFSNSMISIIVLLIQILTFIITYKTSNYIIHTIASFSLIFLDIRFAFMCATNLILCIMICENESPLKKLLGYPDFIKIEVIYDNKVL